MFSQINPIYKGIIFSVAGYASFSVSDTAGKWLTQDYSVMQIISSGAFVASLILLLFSPYLNGGQPLFVKRNIKLHAFRAFLNFLICILSVTSLSLLPLATFYTLVFSKPFLAVPIAILLYGDKAGVYHWLGILFGFIGVVIAFSPDSENLNWAMFLPLLLALCSAIMFVSSRSLKKESIFQLGFYPIFASFILTLPFAIADLRFPDFYGIIGFIFVGFGQAGAIAILSLAFRTVPSYVAVPYQYTQILWGIILGYIFFGELPQAHTLIGAAIIITSGLFLIYRQKQEAKLRAKAA